MMISPMRNVAYFGTANKQPAELINPAKTQANLEMKEKTTEQFLEELLKLSPNDVKKPHKTDKGPVIELKSEKTISILSNNGKDPDTISIKYTDGSIFDIECSSVIENNPKSLEARVVNHLQSLSETQPVAKESALISRAPYLGILPTC